MLVSSVKFLNEQREVAKKFVQAHVELTDWIIKNPEEAQQLIKAELLEETLEEEKEADEKLTAIAESMINCEALRTSPVGRR